MGLVAIFFRRRYPSARVVSVEADPSIEGAEFELLATAPLDRVAEIVAEVHYDLGRR